MYWVAGAAAIAVILYIPTFKFLWDSWMSDNQYSLAFLVPLVSGYFVWRKWPEVRKTQRLPSLWGLALMIFALILHIISLVIRFMEPSAVSIILFLVGGCLYFHGSALVRLLSFPLAYTVFLIPVPEFVLNRVTVPLQLLASGSSASLLKLLGLDISRAGVNLTVEGYNLEIAPACSGMSSLVALVGVSAVFVYVTSLPVVYKWVLFALSVPLALAANIIRITTIALIGTHWGWEQAINIYHDWSSPLLFIIAIMMLFAIS